MIIADMSYKPKEPIKDHENFILSESSKLGQKKKSLKLYQLIERIILAVTGLLLALAPVAFLLYNNWKLMTMLFWIALILLLFVRDIVLGDNKIKEFEISNYEDYLNVEKAPAMKRAEKLFRNHQIELMRYYNLGLNQSRSIFLIGIFCICLGFIFIAISVYLITKGDLEYNEKIVVGIFGVLGNALSSYVATLYLKIVSESNKSLRVFHNRLLGTHDLHFKQYLTNDIKNDDLKGKTISALVTNLNPSNFSGEEA